MQAETAQILAEVYLELKRVRAELQSLRAEVSGNPGFAEGWAEPARAWQALRGEGVKSQKHLQRLRLAGAFSEAKREIRNVSRGERPTWEYHVPNCRKALQRHFQKIRQVS